MEFVEGGKLGDTVKARIRTSRAAAYIETLVDCLTIAHELHIVYRGIKLANILFRNEGTLLIAECGITKQLTIDNCLTPNGVVIGSPNY